MVNRKRYQRGKSTAVNQRYQRGKSTAVNQRLSVVHWFTAVDLPLWYLFLLTIVLSVVHWFTAVDLPLWYLFLLTIVLSVVLWFTATAVNQRTTDNTMVNRKRYQRGKSTAVSQWTTDNTMVNRKRYQRGKSTAVNQRTTDNTMVRRLITPLVSFDHCVVCPSLTFGFWLPLWYLLTIVLSVLLWPSASDYPFGIFIIHRQELKAEWKINGVMVSVLASSCELDHEQTLVRKSYDKIY
jgi:hypothetical protein